MLLRKLKSGGHKALIFTQMARMLDVLEVIIPLWPLSLTSLYAAAYDEVQCQDARASVVTSSCCLRLAAAEHE